MCQNKQVMNHWHFLAPSERSTHFLFFSMFNGRFGRLVDPPLLDKPKIYPCDCWSIPPWLMVSINVPLVHCWIPMFDGNLNPWLTWAQPYIIKFLVFPMFSLINMVKSPNWMEKLPSSVNPTWICLRGTKKGKKIVPIIRFPKWIQMVDVPLEKINKSSSTRTSSSSSRTSLAQCCWPHWPDFVDLFFKNGLV